MHDAESARTPRALEDRDIRVFRNLGKVKPAAALRWLDCYKFGNYNEVRFRLRFRRSFGWEAQDEWRAEDCER
jgi:hypothetical protein